MMSTPDRFRERCPVGVLRCACLLFVVKQALRVRGFAWTMSWIMKPGRARSSLVTDTRHLGGGGGAEGRHGRSLLPWSCTLSRGIDGAVLPPPSTWDRSNARTRSASAPFPRSCAVEHQGRVVNDVLEDVNWFARFPVEFR